MCTKVNNKIECEKCGYLYSEAMYPDNYDKPLSCDSNKEIIKFHINEIERLEADQKNHYYDCKCLICR